MGFVRGKTNRERERERERERKAELIKAWSNGKCKLSDEAPFVDGQ